MEVAGMLAGAAAIAALPYTFAAYGAIQAIALGLSGSLTAAISAAAYKALGLWAAPLHDMRNHVFTPGECEGGRLYYDGDVPILSLDADRPYIAGKAHGYLLGDSLNRLFKQLDFARHQVLGVPRASELSDTIQEVKETIPNEYLEEIKGLVAGYQKWAAEHPFSFPKNITADDIILLHLMPDSIHFSPQAFQARSHAPVPACTSIVGRDGSGRIKFKRLMDWPPFGMAGTYSLIINRKHKHSQRTTVEVGLPGFVGTVTGMNDHGLSLAMNVCPGRTRRVRGAPAAIYNRMCLENCSDVTSLRSFIRNHQPLGPYSLTAADKNEARAFHFYQSHDQRHVERPFTEDEPLTVLNFCYPTPTTRDCSMEHSEERQQMLHAWFEQHPKAIDRSTNIPYVNNWETTHSVLMDPEAMEMSFSANNGWAARHPHLKVPVQKLCAQL